MNRRSFPGPVEKTAEAPPKKTNLAQDFVAGMDPLGAWSSEYGGRNEQAGVGDGEHVLKGAVGVAGGLVGGGIALPAISVGAVRAAQANGGVGKRLAAFGTGMASIPKGIRRARDTQKMIRQAADTPGGIEIGKKNVDDIEYLMRQGPADQFVDVGRKILNKVAPRYANKPAAKAADEIADAAGDAIEAVDTKAPGMIRTIRDLRQGRLSQEAAQHIQPQLDKGMRTMGAGLGIGATFGGVGAGVQYYKGMEGEQKIQDRIHQAQGMHKSASDRPMSTEEKSSLGVAAAGAVGTAGFAVGKDRMHKRHQEAVDSYRDLAPKGSHMGLGQMRGIARAEGFDGDVNVSDRSRWTADSSAVPEVTVNGNRKAEFLHEIGHVVDARELGMSPSQYADSQADGVLRRVFGTANASNKVQAERRASEYAAEIAGRHGLSFGEREAEILDRALQTHRLGVAARNMGTRTKALGLLPLIGGLAGYEGFRRWKDGDPTLANRPSHQAQVRGAYDPFGESNKLAEAGTISVKEAMLNPTPPKPRPRKPRKKDWVKGKEELTDSKIESMT